MPTILERRVAEFVDRMTEMQGFSGFTESQEKLILFIRGPTGMGKSSLLARMRHECGERELPHVAVECREIGLNTYLQIMCKMRDELRRPELFDDFTQLTEHFTAPRQVNLSIVQTIGTVQTGASVKGSDIGTVNVAGGEGSVPEAERMVRLTEQFVGCLERAAQGRRLMVLLDDTHKMTSETTLWLWTQLLKSLLENRLATVRFVVAARERPEMDRYMSDIVEEVELKPLAIEDIAEYLKRREVYENDDERRQDVALGLFATTHGNPMSVATAVDSLKVLLRKQVAANG
jgi:hypothetical protein